MSLIKKVATVAIGICVDYTVSKIIKSNTKTDSKFGRIAVAVGSYAIGVAVADKVSEYVVNDTEETMKEIQNALKDFETIEDPVEEIDADYEVR